MTYYLENFKSYVTNHPGEIILLEKKYGVVHETFFKKGSEVPASDFDYIARKDSFKTS